MLFGVGVDAGVLLAAEKRHRRLLFLPNATFKLNLYLARPSLKRGRPLTVIR